MKISKILLNIMSVVCFVYGALYVFSLVFIPVGIYCFIAGRRFSYKAEHIDNTMFMSNKDFKAYVIFASIACFPFGLLSVIPYIMIVGNRIKISETKESIFSVSDVDSENQSTEKESEKEEPRQVEIQKDSELSDEETQAKFAKLQSFREKGIITEEELELAPEQLFGKKTD